MSARGVAEGLRTRRRVGRVIATYDSGRFVRAYDLTRSGNDATGAASNPLATGAFAPAAAMINGGAGTVTNVAMRLVGPRLFITNGRNLWQYNLSVPDDHYNTTPYELDYPARIRDLFLGQDHSILLNEPVDRGPLGSAFVQLLIHRRVPISPDNPKEPSKLDYAVQINDKSGIFTWQAVDGGMYYLSDDHQLHFLQARH